MPWWRKSYSRQTEEATGLYEQSYYRCVRNTVVSSRINQAFIPVLQDDLLKKTNTPSCCVHCLALSRQP